MCYVVMLGLSMVIEKQVIIMTVHEVLVTQQNVCINLYVYTIVLRNIRFNDVLESNTNVKNVVKFL